MLLALLWLPACSSGSSPTALCGSGPTSTLTVSVVNDTNEPFNVCTAKVVATGPTTLTLKPGGGGGQSNCNYTGTVSAGTYTVTATASGYQTMSIHQTVQTGCNATAAIDVVPVP